MNRNRPLLQHEVSQEAGSGPPLQVSRRKVAFVHAVLEPHVVIKTAHLLEDLVAVGAGKERAHLHVDGSHVAACVVIVGEALAAFAAADAPL